VLLGPENLLLHACKG